MRAIHELTCKVHVHSHLRLLVLERLQQAVVVRLLLLVDVTHARFRQLQCGECRFCVASCQRVVDASHRLHTLALVTHLLVDRVDALLNLEVRQQTVPRLLQTDCLHQ